MPTNVIMPALEMAQENGKVIRVHSSIRFVGPAGAANVDRHVHFIVGR